jgi:hypothetical protein
VPAFALAIALIVRSPVLLMAADAFPPSLA